jgi:aminoglycoside 3-N-acetyltransferase
VSSYREPPGAVSSVANRLPGGAPRRSYHCFITEGERRVEREFTALDLDDSDFGLLGAELEASAEQGSPPAVCRGYVGSAECRLVPLRLAVDFACSWLAIHRNRTVS